MKTYEVTDVHGTVHTVECDFMFNNGGELVLRTGERGNTDVAAIFAAGQWSSCVRLTENRARDPLRGKIGHGGPF